MTLGKTLDPPPPGPEFRKTYLKIVTVKDQQIKPGLLQELQKALATPKKGEKTVLQYFTGLVGAGAHLTYNSQAQLGKLSPIAG